MENTKHGWTALHVAAAPLGAGPMLITSQRKTRGLCQRRLQKISAPLLAFARQAARGPRCRARASEARGCGLPSLKNGESLAKIYSAFRKLSRALAVGLLLSQGGGTPLLLIFPIVLPLLCPPLSPSLAQASSSPA